MAIQVENLYKKCLQRIWMLRKQLLKTEQMLGWTRSASAVCQANWQR